MGKSDDAPQDRDLPADEPSMDEMVTLRPRKPPWARVVAAVFLLLLALGLAAFVWQMIRQF